MRAPKVGDTVKHTNSHRVGKVRRVRRWRDGTFELQVRVDLDTTWWSSRRVRNLTAEQEQEDGREPAETTLGE